MKIRSYFFLLISSFFLAPSAIASPPDEGMWLLSLVNQYNYEVMRQLGCKLTPEEIYSDQHPSVKDAIVSFGDFCTAGFVSADGLLFTNHHCGYDAVANHSTVENDLLDNGFWAKDHSQELTNPGLFVRVLVRMQDVTDSIIPKVKDLSMDDRLKKVQELSKSIGTHASFDGKYKTEVKSMFYGNQYFLFVYQVFNDIRLVATPPDAIGRFGGDTDNWMWPRHTCDFSVFRVYADKNNNPTPDYSPDNVPYKPKHFLPVSLKGLSKGDFAMIIGFPGLTERYLPSYAIEEVINDKNPALIKIIKTMTDVMKQDMDNDPKLRLVLAPDYATLMNSQKLFESQLPGLRKMNLVEMKRREEAEFLAWAAKQPSNLRDQYTSLFDNFRNEYATLSKVESSFYYAVFNVNYSSAGNFALDVNPIEGVLGDVADAETRQKVIDEIKKSAEDYFSKQSIETSKKIMLNMLLLYEQERPGGELPQPVADILSEYKGATPKDKFTTFVNEAYSKSILGSKSKFDVFISKPSMKKLQKDPLYNFYIGLYAKSAEYRQQYSAVNREIAKDMRLYLQGQMQRDPQQKLYPDANFTPRLSYGIVDDYQPRDAVHYNWMTALSGVIEKTDSTNRDFIVPSRLKELYSKKDFGRYNFSGDVPVCFLSTNDITGGNSGSPVMNASGELIGLAFDGNYEGTAGEYEVDPALNRTISVDIRYVLFIIEKYAGATNLISELKIIE